MELLANGWELLESTNFDGACWLRPENFDKPPIDVDRKLVRILRSEGLIIPKQSYPWHYVTVYELTITGRDWLRRGKISRAGKYLLPDYYKDENKKSYERIMVWVVMGVTAVLALYFIVWGWLWTVKIVITLIKLI